MYEPRDYQNLAVEQTLTCFRAAKTSYSESPQDTAIVLRAPTSAGKTVMSGAVIDHLLARPGAVEGHVVLRLTDNPSLNRQSANRVRVNAFVPVTARGEER